MADFARPTPADLHHLRPLPIPGSPLVACRICDAVFSSSQALINHIGAHVSDEGATSRRPVQDQQRRFPAGPAFLTAPRATAVFLPNRYSSPNGIGFEGAESVWGNQISPFGRSVFREGVAAPYPPPGLMGQYFTNLIAMEEGGGGDCTKPYINQLEKCLPKVKGGTEVKKTTAVNCI
uniref:C2H2-type domain-containing protein n=1 Tax=Cucumis sativus TaxID=3659 RepID=A0A0A0LNN3_CUCSA